MSDILVNHGWWILLVVVASTVFIISAFRKPKGQRVWYRWLGRIPVLGEIARKQAISRMAMIVATLLRSGVVFTRALDLAGRSTKNVILREALERACERIGAGRDLGAAFEEATEFPPLVIQIFSVGQASGKLEGMLERLAEDYDRQVAVATARFTAALEPILILLLAVFVGFLLLATMLPILEAGNVL